MSGATIAQCTALDRMMNEELTKIEEDYKQSKEVPPAPPGWAGVVQAIAEVPARGDPMVVNILEQIHESLVKSQDQAITAYRAAIQSRHNHLKNMMPHWREVLQLVSHVKKNIETVIDRSKTIDRHMDEYENVVRQTDRAERMLSSSSLNQFMIAGLVMIIAIGGAFINFHLIARPMAEMVGGTSNIGAFKIAEIAALVIILVELAMGVFLMESFRITRLFPIIGALPDKTRFRLIWVFFGILLILACVEAGLAYMREILLQDELATSAALRGEAAPAAQPSISVDHHGGPDAAWASSCPSPCRSWRSRWRCFVSVPAHRARHRRQALCCARLAVFAQGARATHSSHWVSSLHRRSLRPLDLRPPLAAKTMLKGKSTEKSPKLAVGGQPTSGDHAAAAIHGAGDPVSLPYDRSMPCDEKDILTSTSAWPPPSTVGLAGLRRARAQHPRRLHADGHLGHLHQGAQGGPADHQRGALQAEPRATPSPSRGSIPAASAKRTSSPR